MGVRGGGPERPVRWLAMAGVILAALGQIGCGRSEREATGRQAGSEARAGSAAPGGGAAPSSSPSQGAPAPDFDLTTLSGEPLRLADHRGKVVLVDFWASWCGPCRMEVPHLIDLQQTYGARGFQILGVAVSDREENVRLFADRMGLNYPTGMGTAEVVEAYGGFTSIPTSFLVAPDGSIAARYTGYQDRRVFAEAIEKLLPAVRRPS